jgi:DNA invertase Pin-like site-specific DNA recombinase
MIFGYARVSTGEQDTKAQVEALKAAGCEKVYDDNGSGGRWDRPQLQIMLGQLRAGDVVVVWKLDRLSRSVKDFAAFIVRLESLKVGFRSLTESIDTTTSSGRMFAHMVAAFAEYEREMIRERTMAGLAISRREGRRGGRRFALDAAQQRKVLDDVANGRETAASCARIFKVHRATIDRILARADEQKRAMEVPA